MATSDNEIDEGRFAESELMLGQTVELRVPLALPKIKPTHDGDQNPSNRGDGSIEAVGEDATAPLDASKELSPRQSRATEELSDEESKTGVAQNVICDDTESDSEVWSEDAPLPPVERREPEDLGVLLTERENPNPGLGYEARRESLSASAGPTSRDPDDAAAVQQTEKPMDLANGGDGCDVLRNIAVDEAGAHSRSGDSGDVVDCQDPQLEELMREFEDISGSDTGSDEPYFQRVMGIEAGASPDEGEEVASPSEAAGVMALSGAEPAAAVGLSGAQNEDHIRHETVHPETAVQGWELEGAAGDDDDSGNVTHEDEATATQVRILSRDLLASVFQSRELHVWTKGSSLTWTRKTE